MTQPTKGRIVLVTLTEPYNGDREHPAIVTDVHGPAMINARVLVDGIDNPPWVTSVPHRNDAGGYTGPTWRWPAEETP